MKPFKALSKSCGKKDDECRKITYDTDQFAPYIFNPGDCYTLTYSNGDMIRFRASRSGDTIYSFGKVLPHTQKLPTVGNKVTHEIVDIAKSLKQLPKMIAAQSSEATL